jgi:hypothetical protein
MTDTRYPDRGASSGGEKDVAQLADENARLRHEVEALRESTAGTKQKGRRRARWIITGLLVVLTSIAIVASTLGVWTQRTLSSTDRYVALVAPLADDPAVTNALADRLTSEVFLALDVEDRVRQALASIPQLPEAAGLLVGPITSSTQNLIQERARALLRSERFDGLWEGINRRAHAKLVALLRGDYEELPNVAVTGGEVRLNLVSAVAEVVRSVAQEGADALGLDVTIPPIPPSLDTSAATQRLASALGVTLPAGFGQITIMTADELSGYQDTVRTLRRFLWALLILTLLFLVLTLVVAPDRRRAVIWLGVGVAVLILLVWVFLRRVENNILDRIPGAGADAAAQDVFDRVGDSLRATGFLVLAVAILAALVAYFLGRPPWFQRATAWGGRVTSARPGGSELEVWVAEHANAVRIGGIAAAVIVVFLTGIDWIPVLIVGALLGLLLWGVARSERQVHPPVPASPKRD